MPEGISADRYLGYGGSVAVQNYFRQVVTRVNTLPSYGVFGLTAGRVATNLLDNPHISSGMWTAINSLTDQQWQNYYANHAEPISAGAFPNRANDPYHLTAVNAVAMITGRSVAEIMMGNPGLGFTGSESSFVFRTDDPNLARGTLVHDVTSLLMDVLAYTANQDQAFRQAHGAAIEQSNLNAVLFGSGSIELSALSMALGSFYDSLTDGILPANADLYAYLGPGVTAEQILALANTGGTSRILFNTVTRLGDASGHLAATLAAYYGNDNIAAQIVTEAFASTVGGYLGDAITIDIFGGSLATSTMVTRFANDFATGVARLASGALADALNETLDIENPLGQFVTSQLAASVTNVFIDEAIELLDTEFLALRLDADYARQIMGLGAVNLEFSRVVLLGDVLGNLRAGFGSFLSGQVFAWLDEQWTAFDLSNLGSSIGGIIGGFIAPGIGNFLGQIAGGIVFDLLDGDPRSFHLVRYNIASGDFITEFVFSADDGEVSTSRDLAESAMGSLQLASIIIGGEIRSVSPFEYGHYNDDLVYSGNGSGRIAFADAEQMLARGVLAQLRTMQVEGGNQYALNLVTRPNYAPGLDGFFADLGVADIYDIHKADPYLFGLQMINIADANARNYVLADWQRTLAAAHVLGFDTLPFNDGGEFVTRAGGDVALLGDRGNDFIYAEGGIGGIQGGDGDDIVRFDSGILTNGLRDSLAGNSGLDRYIGDFAQYSNSGGPGGAGIHFFGNGRAWYILNGSDGLTAADFFDFERFEITGTQFKDMVDYTDLVYRFDGGAGTDTINLSLSSATSSVTLDLGSSGQQLIAGTASLTGVERLRDLETGSGDDTIRVGTALLIDSHRNSINANSGSDLYVGDFSSSTAAGLGGEGIRFFRNIPNWYILNGSDGLSAADFYNFERFEITGTQFKDMVDYTDLVYRFDGGAGTDTINLSLSSATSSVTLDLGSSGQQLIAGTASLTGVERLRDLETGSGDDTIRVGTALLIDSHRNSLSANSGNDLYVGDFSSSTAAGTGGAGIRFFRNNPTWYILNGSDGLSAADFYNFERFEITGTQYNDELSGALVNDTLDGGRGNDILFGDDGNDILIGGQGADVLNGGAGTDRVSYSSDTGGLTINLNGVSVGGDAQGDSYVSIEDLVTGSGNDIIIGNALNNVINVGGGSANSASGADGADTIIGGGGNDDLRGGNGNDYLIGGSGNDSLRGDAGANTLQGGSGDDIYYVSTSLDSTLEFAGEGIDTVYSLFNGHFLQANIENLASNASAAFVGIGNALGNVITGLAFRDDLYGLGGDDVLVDGGGAIGNEDTLLGGTGNDTYVVTVRGSSTIEYFNEGIDEVRTIFSVYGLQANIENLTFTDNATHGAGVGNILANLLTGGSGTDDLFGREGNDTLRGGAGNANTLLGQEGDDLYIVEASGDSVIEFTNQGIDTVQTALAIFALRAHVENLTYTGTGTFTGIGAVDNNQLTGGAGADFLSGLDGNDILIGKSGADFLLGGAGVDQYRYEGGETGFDRITDFISGIDKIALRDAGFAQTATIALVQSGVPVATTTNSTFLYNINDGILRFDADGTGAGAAIVLTQLNAGLTLAPGDFLFY